MRRAHGVDTILCMDTTNPATDLPYDGGAGVIDVDGRACYVED